MAFLQALRSSPGHSVADALPAAPPTPLAQSALSTQAWVLDIGERIVIAGVYANFALRMLTEYAEPVDLVRLLVVVSEFLPLLLILMRKPSATLSDRPTDWIFGMAGATAPMLLVPVAVAPLVPGAVCLMLVVAGMCVQISAKLILGFGFGIVAANRGVKVQGPYRFVRHPMYVGYTITHVGSLLAMWSIGNASVYAVALCIQISRILREERVLMRDPGYRGYAARVRYRLLPGVF